MLTKFILFVGLFLSFFTVSAQSEAELLAHWKVDSIPGSSAFNNAYNEVWGLVVDGREYAIIGTTLGTHIFDLADPTQPEEIFFIKGGTSSPQVIHRDYHDYQGYLYAVADEGSQSTLQIIDISTLPASIDVVYDSGDLIFRSHNIFIDTATAKLYSCISNGRTVNFSPMRVFDISDPIEPKEIGAYRSIGNVSISQVHDAYIDQDTAYLNCGPRGLMIVNFADMENPELLSYIESGALQLAGYNHSGWLSEDRSTYYVSDEEWGEPIKVLDVRDKLNVELATTIDAGSDSRFSIAHNQVVAGDYLYISYYYDGLQVYDISDPLQPVRVMHYPTSKLAHTNTYEGSWGVYPLLPSGNIIVSDMQEGLFIIKAPDVVETSIQNIPLGSHQLYPNPSNGEITLDLEEMSGSCQISIYNTNGQCLIEQSVHGGSHISIQVSSLMSNSIYFVEIKNEKNKFIGKFTKL